VFEPVGTVGAGVLDTASMNWDKIRPLRFTQPLALSSPSQA
jgi:hypothetical protein